MNSDDIIGYSYDNFTAVNNIDLILAEVNSITVKTTNLTGYNSEQIVIDTLHYKALYDKLINNFHIIALLIGSLVTSIILLVINCRQKNDRKRLRLSIFLAHLSLVNVCLSVGLLLAVFMSEIVYSRPAADPLNSTTIAALIYAALRELLRYIIVEKFAHLQSFFLLLISIERYLSLFPNYKPSFSSPKWFYTLIIAVYILLLIIIDHRLLNALFGPVESASICIITMVLPTLLAFAFGVSALVHLRCQQRIFYHNNDISFISALLVIMVLQLVGQIFSTLELVHYNFAVDYVINLEQPSDGLNQVFNILYKIGHYLFLTSPLYISLILLVFVHKHRKAVINGFVYVLETVTCLRVVEKLDYNSETMRSILAEQTKSKSFRMYPSTSPLNPRIRQPISTADKV